MKCLLFDLSIVKLTNNHFGDFSIYLYKIDTRITFDIHFIFANQYTTHVVNFYNPQNEMFQRFKTKCSFLQNEAYLCKSFFLP